MKIILCIAMILFVSYTSALAAREKCGTQANGRDEIKGTNVISFPVKYDVEKNNWNLTAVNVECANVDGDKPFEWRSKYGWAAFCGPKGPTGEAACGKCLAVKNRGGNNGVVKVRIVDTCGTGGVDLDEPVFNELDTDGHGHNAGHLMVDYEFVDCGDDKVNGKFNFKNILASAINRV